MLASNSATLKVIDNTYFSIGFPNENWEQLLPRDNYISLIEEYFATDTSVVFIEGDEDSGKTTLCAQMARKHADYSITVFFNPLNNLDYKLEFYYSNVVAQIRNILGQQEQESDSFHGVEEYQKSMFQLRKILKKSTSKIFLIIDGLEERLQENIEFVNQLLSFVPIADPMFKIVLTGNRNDFLNILPRLKKEETKAISLSGFASPEISQYLGVEGSKENEMRLYRITKGFPGRLRTLKSLMQKEKSLDKIFTTSTYKEWIELDCESVDLNKPVNNGILSLLALSDHSYTVEMIASIFALSEDQIERSLVEVGVLEHYGTNINFVSSAYKKYFANILRGNIKKIQESLIGYYAKVKTVTSMIELPKLYAENNQWPKIVELIDEEYPKRILEGTGSLKMVMDSLEIGMKASEKLNRYTDMWRYSFEASIVNELDNYLFWESEIKARISIRDFAGSISLAESAVLKVDRLRLLALIARKEKEIKNNVDEELVKLIQELYQATDLASVGDKVYDIVADLIYAIPNLAIEMIEKSSGNSSEKNINDWVIAKLSIAAIDSSLKDNENPDESKKLGAIGSLNNPHVKKINQAISFMVGNYTSEKVLEEVNKLTDSKERLRLLRLWLSNNRTNTSQIESVIGRALDELITASSEASLTLDVLTELSNQLPYVKDNVAKEKLLSRFQAIEKDFTELGVSKNKYIYQANIFHTQLTLKSVKAVGLMIQTIKEIENIDDVLIKLEAYAEIYCKLKVLKHSELQKQYSFVYSRLLNLSEDLLKTTASHFKVLKPILKTIGNKNPSLAIKICEQINTQRRREDARLLVGDSYLDNNLRFVNIEALQHIRLSLESDVSQQELLLNVLERFSSAKNLHFEVITSLLPYTYLIKDIKDPITRALAYVDSYIIVTKNSSMKSKHGKRFEDLISQSLSEIEEDWERIDIGFTICAKLANINELYANKLFNESEKLKSGSWIDSRPVAYAYLNSIKVILRAFSGLLVSSNDTKDDYKIIEDLINRIPSQTIKLTLWTEAAFIAYSVSRIEIAKKILDNHILHLVQGLIDKKNDIGAFYSTLTLIHLFNPSLVNDFLKNTSKRHIEIVYGSICNYYVTKKSPYESYEKTIHRYNTSYSDLVQASDALSNVDTDVLVYQQIDNICKAIAENKSSLSDAQVTTLIDRIAEIVEAKLPDLKNIKHDGFKILARMKLARFKKAGVNYKQLIPELIDCANLIPNKSDIIFVKAVMLNEIPFDKANNGAELKAKLHEDIITDLQNLKVHYEYIERVIDISDLMYDKDRVKWKEIVSKAFAFSSDLEDGSQEYSSKKKLIDSMHRLEPSYAKELIKLTDVTNRENKIGDLLKEHYETLEISNKVKNNKVLSDREKENAKAVVNSVSIALKSLNSEKISAKKIAEVTGYLTVGNKLPLYEVYPVYAYYLSNCAKTYKVKRIEGPLMDLHKKNFKAVVRATNLIPFLSQRRKFTEMSVRKFFIDEEFASNAPVRPNTREEAFNYIKKWLEDEAQEFIIIADPYFVKEDLEILKVIKEINSNVDIEILGSKQGPLSNTENEFKDYWKKISDESAPFTNITFCWIPEQKNDTPFHDRWIITKNGGLRLGTSINSLGKGKESELSVMKPSEALNIMEKSLHEYVTRKKRELNNLRISYKSFTL